MASTYSLDFDGSSGEVTHASSEPRTAFSLFFWAKPDSVTANQYVWDGNHGGGSNNRTVILGFQDGYWNFFNNGYPTGTAADTQIAATAGAWQHVGWTWDGTTLKGYLDGVEQYSLTVSVDPMATITSRDMGSSGGANWYGGLIDDAAIWSAVLTPTNVADLAAGSITPGSLSTGLVLYLAMEEGTGNPQDSSGNGRHGTIAGGVTWVTDVPGALSGGGGGGGKAAALLYRRRRAG